MPRFSQKCQSPCQPYKRDSNLLNISPSSTAPIGKLYFSVAHSRYSWWLLRPRIIASIIVIARYSLGSAREPRGLTVPYHIMAHQRNCIGWNPDCAPHPLEVTMSCYIRHWSHGLRQPSHHGRRRCSSVSICRHFA